MTSIDTAEDRTRSKRPIAIAAVVALIAVAGGVWYFFIRDDAPPAFDIDSAADSTGGAGSTDVGASIVESVDGDWVVDVDAGAEAGGTSAGFRVDEELTSIGATTAVGRSSVVVGTLTIEGTTVTAVEIGVDMTALESDDSRRDGKMKSALGTDEFPSASFTLTEPIEFGRIPEPGETINAAAVGQMTIKGVTNDVELSLDAQIVGDTLVVVGSMPVVFADYGVETPSAAIVVSVADEGTIEFQLFFSRA